MRPRLNLNYVILHSTPRAREVKMSRFKVFVGLHGVPRQGLDLLTAAGCDLDIWHRPGAVPRPDSLVRVRGVHAILCSAQSGIKVDEELLQAAGPNLKVIGNASVGYDHIDIAAAKRHNVRVGNTPNVLTDTVAEMTVAILLATARRLFEGNRALMEGKWRWTPTWMCGTGLKGSTVGLFGFGRIAQATVALLKPFGVHRFIYNSRNPHPEFPSAEFVPFDQLLADSDYLLVIASLNAQTRGIFDSNAFSKMKPSAVLINTARGELVNQGDLVQALKTGQIRAAGLDVMTPEPLPPDHELCKLENCVLIPHMGSAELETRTAMATMTARNIIAALTGGQMEAQVC